jgi:hypothetical protein
MLGLASRQKNMTTVDLLRGFFASCIFGGVTRLYITAAMFQGHLEKVSEVDLFSQGFALCFGLSCGIVGFAILKMPRLLLEIRERLSYD